LISIDLSFLRDSDRFLRHVNIHINMYIYKLNTRANLIPEAISSLTRKHRYRVSILRFIINNLLQQYFSARYHRAQCITIRRPRL